MFHNKFDINNTFFMSDPHFNHKNYCKGISNWVNKDCCRDFDSLDNMNSVVLESINKTVKEDSHLFILGDFLFGHRKNLEEFRNNIKCNNIYLIFGNHDDKIRNARNVFNWSGNYLEIFLGKHLVCLFHYPISIWRECHKGSWLLCGHSHGTHFESTKNCKSTGKILDVGWDSFKKPLDYFEIKSIMNTKEYNPKDHHDSTTT